MFYTLWNWFCFNCNDIVIFLNNSDFLIKWFVIVRISFWVTLSSYYIYKMPFYWQSRSSQGRVAFEFQSKGDISYCFYCERFYLKFTQEKSRPKLTRNIAGRTFLFAEFQIEPLAIKVTRNNTISVGFQMEFFRLKGISVFTRTTFIKSQ